MIGFIGREHGSQIFSLAVILRPTPSCQFIGKTNPQRENLTCELGSPISSCQFIGKTNPQHTAARNPSCSIHQFIGGWWYRPGLGASYDPNLNIKTGGIFLQSASRQFIKQLLSTYSSALIRRLVEVPASLCKRTSNRPSGKPAKSRSTCFAPDAAC